MSSGLRYAVNCSLLFTELPLLARPVAAREAGFTAVEFWWPWPEDPVPGDPDIDSFVSAVKDAGVTLIGLNFFAGDLAGPDCGVLSVPERSSQFRDNVDVAVGIGAELGVRGFNALFGNRVEGASPAAQDELGVDNLITAAVAAGAIGADVLVEPVSGPKPYPLRTAADVVAILDRVEAAGTHNIGMLCDLFHLANNGDDVAAAIEAHAGRIRHVQIADHPGRGEPGTGHLDLEAHLGRLQSAGYAGYVALEYNPSTTTAESLRWLPLERRASSPDAARHEETA